VSYWSNIWSVLKADGIALDETEAALLGAPSGETISLWSAMEALHGVWPARLACLIWAILIEWRHCHKQLLGQPMPGLSYVRAAVCLMAVPATLVFLISYGVLHVVHPN
jgi:hypothetical protein